MSQSQHKHLIIAGVTRAATTSLFEYLSDHPQVQRSSIKETRYFLADEYPLPRHLPQDSPLSAYLSLFGQPDEDKTRLEATPDYLFCDTAAKRIKECLPDARLVFILREPIERLVSWFRYARQNNRLDLSMTFDQYVEAQREADPNDPSTPQHMRSLAQGRYAGFLAVYLKMFAPGQCLVLRYDQLQREPRQTLKAICKHAGIDPCFFDGYTFDVLNPSVTVRSRGLHTAYKRLAWSVRSKVIHRPGVHGLLRKVRRMFHPAYMKINQQSDKAPNDPPMSEQTRAFLEDYYQHEPDALTKLTGDDFSAWARANTLPSTPDA
jgi:uncharacterized short protein YbdD (DUF466 family)